MENFFLIGCQIEEIELKELLLRKYHSLKFIEEMKLDEFLDFISLAIENENKEKYERQYLALLPFLCLRGKYMTFEQFYEQMSGSNIDWRPADEIMREIEEKHRQAGMKDGIRDI